MTIVRVSSLCAALVFAGASWSESPRPFPDFSAKRVGVPKPGQRPSIVQIDPTEQARLLAALPKQTQPLPDIAQRPNDDGPETRDVGAFSAFWSYVSADLGASGPGRLQEAIGAVAATADVPEPRLQHLQQIARENGVDILRSTVGTQVSPALVLAVISVESSGNADAVSSAGAQGLMQLMPATAERFGVTDSLDPAQNIRGGVAYLDWLMGEFDSDPVVVLAGYNAGEGSVQKYNGVPPFAETRDYVPKVIAAFNIARGLCLTPPELVSDGCAFAGLN